MWRKKSFIWIILLLVTLVRFGYGNTSGLPTYYFVAGEKAELPCDLNVSSTEDEVSLVLWHRDESGSPLYSVDARDLPLPTATHFPAVHMETRAYFNSSAVPAFLRIDGIQKEDEGVYRCRVEYRRARTETMELMLFVIVPPSEAIIMDEFGQHLHGIIGPYNEDQPVSLICEGEGGEPSPSVRWLKGNELIDDTFFLTPQGFARNEVQLPNLHRKDLLTNLTCEVYNNNLTSPVTSTVSLDMNLRPTDVRITSPYQPLSAGKDTDIVCVARGARPPAQISWWLDGEKLTTTVTESTAEEDNLTISSLNLRPTIQDNHRNLSCRGDNPQLTDSVIEDTWLINVHYLPQLTVKINVPLPVTEKDSVAMTCDVQAHPPITELEWLIDGRSLGPPAKANFSNRIFQIPSVGPENKGVYQCAGTNSEGRSMSEPIHLDIFYAPRCESVRSSVYGVGRTESVSVTCAVDANPTKVNFSWILSNPDKSSPLPAAFYTSNGTKSIATVSPRAPEDYGVLQCWASNNVGPQKEPCSFRIIPAGVPDEPRNCLVTNRTSDCIVVDCDRGEDGGLQQVFQLEVMNINSNKFIANLTSRSSPNFNVCSLPAKESFIFVVYSVNSKGRSKPVTVRSSTLEYLSTNEDLTDQTDILTAVFGIVIGALFIVALLIVVIAFSIKIRSRRCVKDQPYQKEHEKCDTYLMKDCKESCIPNNQGPDIIPEKSFLQDRSEDKIKSCELDDDGNLSTVLSDKSLRKYSEYQGVTYSDDSELISTPKKLRLLQEIDGDIVEDNGITIETPLISSIPTTLQQWSDQRSESLRLSTPV
ncbi:cell adhesion molecule CEACAM1-like [Parasteatoda tepidariorum]|uniref:cell adhesion molecule CEACAM1-like n=1 Tax=Parasteatoda tepidariorum TaxID=114398 RepID=UPI001C71BBC6|nr:nephrin-like [Parasteatoda tepidariorum]